MEFSWIDTHDLYQPILNPSGSLAETVEDYCVRIGSLLPNFPHQVLSQWFFDH